MQHSPDSTILPTAREMSSIPMNSQGELWEYPSPQQMLNAINRKGYEDTDPDDVPAMVAVHNWLNEGSWQQILKWEKKYFPYLTLKEKN
jgi:cytochrome c heme-lyase